MILVVLGFISILFGSVTLALKDSIKAFLGLVLVFIGMASIFLGLTVPLAGYEETKLVDTKELHPLALLAYEEEIDPQARLLVDIEDGQMTSYKYCVVRNGFFDVDDLPLKDTDFVYQENLEKPTIEFYEQKAKRTPFCICLGADRKSYVITIPKSMISYRIISKVEIERREEE